MSELVPITVRVNGREHSASVEPRMLLSDFLRHGLRLTGTHVGCEQGVCGCCTVLYDGVASRSCLMFAVQADGAEIRTVEGLAGETLHPVQQAFHDAHALQCGFCTPGFVMSVVAFLEEEKRADFSDEEIMEVVSGGLCRCTGYRGIIDAVKLAARQMYGARG